MTVIDRNDPPTEKEMEDFLKSVYFPLPVGFIDFFKEANGADIISGDNYILLWPLTQMVQLNKDYNVDEFAPGFFLFGSDGGDTAYAIEKTSGDIYEMPFIGMSQEEAVFKSKTLNGLMEGRDV